MPKRTPKQLPPERDKVAVGNRLRLLRKALGLQAKDIAERVNVAQNTWSQWETGTRMADLHAMMRVWDKTGADLNYIFMDRRDRLPADLSDKIEEVEAAEEIARLAETREFGDGARATGTNSETASQRKKSA